MERGFTRRINELEGDAQEMKGFLVKHRNELTGLNTRLTNIEVAKIRTEGITLPVGAMSKSEKDAEIERLRNAYGKLHFKNNALTKMLYEIKEKIKDEIS